MLSVEKKNLFVVYGDRITKLYSLETKRPVVNKFPKFYSSFDHCGGFGAYYNDSLVLLETHHHLEYFQYSVHLIDLYFMLLDNAIFFSE